MPSSHWEELISRHPDGDLEQGDIIDNRDFLKLPHISHLIILTQTCDLVLRPVKGEGASALPRRSMAMVAPALPFPTWVAMRHPDMAPHNVAKKVTRFLNWNSDDFLYLPDPVNLDGAGLLVFFDALYPLPLHDETSVAPYQALVDARLARVVSPWRERLGEVASRMFHRIATNDPSDEQVRNEVERQLK